jgi:Short-chain dehydrogenases of various substrate specificities
MGELTGRSVVLTGVGREGQLGEAVARAFASRGARVFLVDRDADVARARADALLASGLRAAGLGADLSDVDAVAALAVRLKEASGGHLEAVVHLAGGYATSGPVAESDPAVWAAQIAVNATTAYLVARAFIPLLRPSKGALLFVASEAVLPGGRMANHSAYAASKSAVVALAHAIAQEETEHGVRANALAPTTIRTAANVAAMGANTRMVAREDVAEAAVWLCSPGARAVTGQVVAVR